MKANWRPLLSQSTAICRLVSFSTDTTKGRENSAQVKSEDDVAINEVTSDDDLQPQWRALEHRVNQRKTKKIGEGPRGRSPRRPGAWDHESV